MQFAFLVSDAPKCDTDTCVGLSSGTADVYTKDATGNPSTQTKSIRWCFFLLYFSFYVSLHSTFCWMCCYMLVIGLFNDTLCHYEQLHDKCKHVFTKPVIAMLFTLVSLLVFSLISYLYFACAERCVSMEFLFPVVWVHLQSFIV